MYLRLVSNALLVLLMKYVASYDFFFLYADRNHNGKIDKADIEIIRNPAWHKEWNLFEISTFLPIEERDFAQFIIGTLLLTFFGKNVVR